MIKKIIQLIVVLLFTTSGVMAQSVEIADVTQPPGQIEVQVDMLSFTDDVAAITLTIEYDSALMDFVGINDTQLTGSWIANYSAGTDQLVIIYNATPTGTGYPINGKLLDMVFDYHGGFGTAITFDEANCEIADADLNILTSSYVDGSVTQSAAVGTISMDNLIEPIGNTVDMPVTIEGAGYTAVDAITLKIAYDDTQLTFVGLTNTYSSMSFVANAGSGVLTVTWAGTAQDFTSLATLFDAQFVYYGGNADVEFIPGCEISSSTVPLATSYVDGTVIPDPTVDGTLTIGTVGASSDSSNVSVPITASGFGTSNLGAITLEVTYHDSLIYTGFTNGVLTGWLLTGNSNNVLSFAWTKVAGQTPVDGDIITLNFRYDYDGGGVASISFDPGCEVKSVNLVNIPVTYVDGSVASLGVSGVLKYANTAGDRPLASSTVNLKSGATTVATTTTDASGNYAFTGVGVGSYTLTASTTIVWGGVNIVDALVIRFQSGTFVPGTMKFYAADVNESSSVNIIDALIIKSWVDTAIKPGAWTASDWIFSDPSVSVIDSSITGEIITAVCSGDANLSYTP